MHRKKFWLIMVTIERTPGSTERHEFETVSVGGLTITEALVFVPRLIAQASSIFGVEPNVIGVAVIETKPITFPNNVKKPSI